MASQREGDEHHLGVVSSGTVTVLTVDDQAIFRQAATRLISATPEFEQIAQAASGLEALDLAAELHPDLVLVDVRMPGMDGIETARRLAESNPEAALVLISLEEVAELPSSLSSIGAAVHLRKQDLSTRTLRAVWAAHVRRRARADR
jgi:two-component system, NarL family, invasion response regulator UvrY